MSKEAWFREFERIEAERPEITDDEVLSDMASEALRDKMADEADHALDRYKDSNS